MGCGSSMAHGEASADRSATTAEKMVSTGLVSEGSASDTLVKKQPSAPRQRRSSAVDLERESRAQTVHLFGPRPCVS